MNQPMPPRREDSAIVPAINAAVRLTRASTLSHDVTSGRLEKGRNRRERHLRVVRSRSELQRAVLMTEIAEMAKVGAKGNVLNLELGAGPAARLLDGRDRDSLGTSIRASASSRLRMPRVSAVPPDHRVVRPVENMADLDSGARPTTMS
jgi:hypothetical protein